MLALIFGTVQELWSLNGTHDTGCLLPIFVTRPRLSLKTDLQLRACSYNWSGYFRVMIKWSAELSNTGQHFYSGYARSYVCTHGACILKIAIPNSSVTTAWVVHSGTKCSKKFHAPLPYNMYIGTHFRLRRALTCDFNVSMIEPTCYIVGY